MKERILRVVVFVVLAACFLAGAKIIFDTLHAMDGRPNVQDQARRRQRRAATERTIE